MLVLCHVIIDKLHLVAAIIQILSHICRLRARVYFVPNLYIDGDLRKGRIINFMKMVFFSNLVKLGNWVIF